MKVQPPSVGPLAPFLGEDEDGQRFLDFLSHAVLDLAGPFGSDQMIEIRRELSRQLSSFQAPIQVRRKLVWLGRYFNSVLEKTPIKGVVPFLKQYRE